MTSLVAPFFAVNSGGCESEFSPHVSEKRFHKIKLDLCMYVCILIRMIGLLNNLSLSLTMSLKRRTLCACGVQIHQMVTKKHRHLDFQPSDQAPFSFLPRWRLFVRKR